jgi:hypothetical protein
MHRVAVALAGVVVLLVGVIAAVGGGATAQDDPPAAHPVVGGWRLANEAGDGTDLGVSYAVFHPDGTYTEASTDGVTFIGVWAATGARTADLAFFGADLDLDPTVTIRGEGRQAVEVDEAGNAFAARGPFEARDPAGALLFGDDLRSLGTRLEVAPAGTPGTPGAGTPAP